MNERKDHFMPTSLLDSQFDALERLSQGEYGAEFDITQPYERVVTQSESYVRETLI